MDVLILASGENLKGASTILVASPPTRHLCEFVGFDDNWVGLSLLLPCFQWFAPRLLVSKSFEAWLQKRKSGLFEVKPDGLFRSLATGSAVRKPPSPYCTAREAKPMMQQKLQ
jgi:hypothetical protein